MATSRRTPAPADENSDGTIVDVDVTSEMESSFLEYAYSVIYSRALPDARDGLKPVQRRILYMMDDMGLRPDRGHVKSQRVVGEVMGKLHPHGDTAIYDALVRMAQDFSMRLPLVDGHGNFGSLDNGPAAPRYTEARPARAATLMTDSLDEDVVEMIPNYDNQLTQPEVLPAQFPNLLVNGASGIAVGMATNMPPHNLVEVIAAARHLIAHPDASLEDLMRLVPGPDLPSGGRIVGLEGIRDAYRTGRGSFKVRATTRIENVTSRKKGIVVTELPYQVGPEKVAEKLRDAVQSKKVQGISDYQDLTDRHHGLRLVLTVKSGFNPEAVLEQLYRYTPMEDSFGINNVALVEGQPRTLGLKSLLEVFVDHRLVVVRRRTEHRLRRRQDRLHLVEGLLIAILDIDEVIQIIRAADDGERARTALMSAFDLSQAQAEYILELRLRRLTKFSRLELESERDSLRAEIEELERILGSEQVLRDLVSAELAAVAAEHGTPRRTVLLEAGAQPAPQSSSLEVADEPCRVLLSGSGLVARTAGDAEIPREGGRSAHDVLVSQVLTTTRSQVGAVTDRGRLLHLGVVDLPSLAPTAAAPSLAGGTRLSDLLALDKDEKVIALVRASEEDRARGGCLALGTRDGVVKRVSLDFPRSDGFEIIGLKGDDRVVGVVDIEDDTDLDLVMVSSDAQLLHFPASGVRPQGRSAGGVAGIKLSAGATVVAFTAVDVTRPAEVVTIAGTSQALPGTQTGSLKVSDLTEFPAKGRATGGVRCHRFLRGEDVLIGAWVVPSPARACSESGQPIDLPEPVGRRDGSGTPVAVPVAAVG
ncbi:DNA gyrase/topoisomerase IV subunit A [Brachybacterium phenoliresistens]|uniref:DNA topoisomerase (ATP-hydrolyzing) n=1 Tax=Brachybacterium phenoliresistens TaxID=396014 RepID=Z9JYI9_9MICO|nr:DNA topoisomerase IV subunit A [Brachybacterium phenoliresistens]EWS82881.1 DNA topoisomerase IV subunit A [Brachybacterium phenoliresistens]